MRLVHISQKIKSHDPELYVDKSSDGVPCVFRRTTGYERYDLGGISIMKYVNRPHLVFALTDNWSVKGTPVEWGIEPIIAKLKECDSYQRNIVEDLIKSYEKADRAKQREFRNNAEAFFSHERKRFAQAMDGINTSQIKSDKNNKRRNRKWEL